MVCAFKRLLSVGRISVTSIPFLHKVSIVSPDFRPLPDTCA